MKHIRIFYKEKKSHLLFNKKLKIPMASVRMILKVLKAWAKGSFVKFSLLDIKLLILLWL